MTINDNASTAKGIRWGLIIAGGFGALGLGLVALTTPFVLPALRKHCLPYVPATDIQLLNLSRAIRKHANKGGRMLDIGSGDGRICRMCAKLGMFSQVHGVELNYPLVLFARSVNFKSGDKYNVRYFHRDLWQFPLSSYDSICIFGVECMMGPLQKYLLKSHEQPQTIFACRFKFTGLNQIDEVGSGIDTVWVYKLD